MLKVSSNSFSIGYTIERRLIIGSLYLCKF